MVWHDVCVSTYIMLYVYCVAVCGLAWCVCEYIYYVVCILRCRLWFGMVCVWVHILCCMYTALPFVVWHDVCVSTYIMLYVYCVAVCGLAWCAWVHIIIMLYTMLQLVVWYVVCVSTLYYVVCIVFYSWRSDMSCVWVYIMVIVCYVTVGGLVCPVCEYIYYVVCMLCYRLRFGMVCLKGLAQAKIIKKSVILFRVLNMTIWCKHVHRLELQFFYNFCAAHSPVRLDIETKFPHFLFLTWLSIITNQEFRLYI